MASIERRWQLDTSGFKLVATEVVFWIVSKAVASPPCRRACAQRLRPRRLAGAPLAPDSTEQSSL
jgi:hypothetical protein